MVTFQLAMLVARRYWHTCLQFFKTKYPTIRRKSRANIEVAKSHEELPPMKLFNPDNHKSNVYINQLGVVERDPIRSPMVNQHYIIT